MKTHPFPKTSPFVESFPTVVLRDRRDIERMMNISEDGWLLLVCPRRMNFMIMDIISRLGESGPVRVVDGGNCFEAHNPARRMRASTPRALSPFQGALQGCSASVDTADPTGMLRSGGRSHGDPQDATRCCAIDKAAVFGESSLQDATQSRRTGRTYMVLREWQLEEPSATDVADATDGGSKPPRLGLGQWRLVADSCLRHGAARLTDIT